MHIAGGLYYELCDVPKWTAQFGSGGRAAATVSSLSPRSTLHTYTRDPNGAGANYLKSLGLQLSLNPSNVAIAFAYFHPLSQPHIEPKLESIIKQDPLLISADVVLRFGFLEGSAIVHATHAIYDPQTAHHPEQFTANGSTAKHLALVMNELEICRYAACDSVADAADKILVQQTNAVVIVKRGVRGATVFETGRLPCNIPAYRSSRVFKIGTGDVFSATFAHYWAEAGFSAELAADLASRSVAAYCETMTLPVDNALRDNRKPVGLTPGQVVLRGSVCTIGRRFTLEEARFRLAELGINVISPDLNSEHSMSALNADASLMVIADGLTESEIYQMCAGHTFKNKVILDEEGKSKGLSLDAQLSADFASAIYLAAWPRDFLL